MLERSGEECGLNGRDEPWKDVKMVQDLTALQRGEEQKVRQEVQRKQDRIEASVMKKIRIAQKQAEINKRKTDACK